MKAFVTGAAGFIGSTLVDRLLADGHEVTGFDNLSTGFLRFLDGASANPRFRLVQSDLLDLDAVTAAMAGTDLVFHLAANADVRFGPDRPCRDLEQNTMVTSNVLEAMRANGASRIAFSSTGSVYGEPDVFPTPESAPFPVQTSLYGASKIAAEGLITAYVSAFGFQAYIFRFVSIPGANALHARACIRFLSPIAGTSRSARCPGQRPPAQIVPLRAGLRECHPPRGRALHGARQHLQPGHRRVLRSQRFHPLDQRRTGPGPAIDVCRRRAGVGWATAPSSSWIVRACGPSGWKPELTIQQGIVRTLEFLRENPWMLEVRP